MTQIYHFLNKKISKFTLDSTKMSKNSHFSTKKWQKLPFSKNQNLHFFNKKWPNLPLIRQQFAIFQQKMTKIWYFLNKKWPKYAIFSKKIVKICHFSSRISPKVAIFFNNYDQNLPFLSFFVNFQKILVQQTQQWTVKTKYSKIECLFHQYLSDHSKHHKIYSSNLILIPVMTA